MWSSREIKMASEIFFDEEFRAEVERLGILQRIKLGNTAVAPSVEEEPPVATDVESVDDTPPASLVEADKPLHSSPAEEVTPRARLAHVKESSARIIQLPLRPREPLEVAGKPLPEDMEKLNIEQEQELFKLIRAGQWAEAQVPADSPELLRMIAEGKTAMGRLVAANLRRVKYIVRDLAPRYPHIPWDDLELQAYIGLMKAAQRFTPSRGLRFSTYATPTMIGEIKRYARDKGETIRPSRTIYSNYSAYKKARSELAQSLSREPTSEEISAHSGIPQKVVDQILLRPTTISISPTDATAEDEDFTVTSIEAPDPYDEFIVNESLKSVMQLLPERERQIIEALFFTDSGGRHCGLSQTEVGKLFGIAQMHVSRLSRGALLTLRDLLEADNPTSQMAKERLRVHKHALQNRDKTKTEAQAS